MPQVTGTVSKIYVGTNYCCVTIAMSGGVSGTWLLWSYQLQPDNATNRLLHANYLALTRDAFIHNTTLTMTHPEGSALVTEVAVP